MTQFPQLLQLLLRFCLFSSETSFHQARGFRSMIEDHKNIHFPLQGVHIDRLDFRQNTRNYLFGPFWALFAQITFWIRPLLQYKQKKLSSLCRHSLFRRIFNVISNMTSSQIWRYRHATSKLNILKVLMVLCGLWVGGWRLRVAVRSGGSPPFPHPLT